MNCNEFETQLDQCIENRSDLSAELIAHGTGCSTQSCRNRWQEHQLLSTSINAWLRSVPKVDLTDSVLANNALEIDNVEVLGPVPLARRKHSEAGLSGAVVAAMSLLVTACILIAITFRPTGSELANNSRDKFLNSTLVPGSDQQIRPEEEQQLRELGQTYASLMTGAKSKVTDTLAMVIPDHETMKSAGMGSTSAWLDSWSERLEPLETKLDQTLKNFVNETISEMNDQAS